MLWQQQFMIMIICQTHLEYAYCGLRIFFPSATIDQYYFPVNDSVAVKQNNWNNFITQRLAMKVPPQMFL